MRITYREWDNSESAKRQAASLESNEIQVWSAAILHAADQENQQDLTEDELVRARRFQVQHARDEFVSGRRFLRQLLGACLNRAPSSVRFRYTQRGKPFLDDVDVDDISFNLSHSGDLVVIALARGVEVGIDIERRDGRANWQTVAQRIFSVRELAEMKQLPVDRQREAFFNAWTRKEAYLKATGEGMSEDLQAIEVTVSPETEPQLRGLPIGPEAAREWRLAAVPLPTNFSGTVAFRPGASSQVG